MQSFIMASLSNRLFTIMVYFAFRLLEQAFVVDEQLLDGRFPAPPHSSPSPAINCVTFEMITVRFTACLS